MSIRFRCKCGREFKVPDSAAGKNARCRDCGRQFTVPGTPAASAGASAPRRAAPRPAAPPAAPRPAAPAPADDVPVARLVPEDDVPMARPAPRTGAAASIAAHRAKRRRLGPVQVTMGICTTMILLMAVDIIVVLAGTGQGVQGLGWMHAAWLLFLVIGFFIAAAAAQGSRFCIGVLIGGAFRGLLNGANILMFMMAGKSFPFWPALPDWMMIYGWAALGLAAVYIVLLLASSGTRKHLSGHGGVVAGAAIFGFLFGELVAPTALPSAGMLYTRVLARPAALRELAAQIDAPQMLTKRDRENLKTRMRNNVVAIHQAMSTYVHENFRQMPKHLGELVHPEDCPPASFVLPGKEPPAWDEKTKKLSGELDVKYLFAGYHIDDLPSPSGDELRQLVICYTEPSALLGDGAVIMRAPEGLTGVSLVDWVDTEMLEIELAYTERWKKRHPPRAQKPPADGP